ncbi:MAG: Coenzyme PQQ synthesis protein E [Myxococcota bacterium]|nr:Coenzyme PQQ synthesis protein E [Myxococcota bacterium]
MEAPHLDRDQITKYLRGVSHRINYPLLTPEKVTLLVTHRCPLKCVMCWTHESHKENEMTIEELRRAVDDASAWGVKEIMFSGGEPLLRKREVIELVGRANRHGVKTSVITSGILTTDQAIADLHDQGLNVLMMSCDGPDAETHESVRGIKGSFAKLDRTLKLGASFKGKPRPHIQNERLRHDFSVGTMSVIMKQNVHRLTDMYDWSHEGGANFVCFQAVTYDPKNRVNWVTRDQIPVLERQIEDIIARGRKRGNLGVGESFLRSIPQYFIDPSGVKDRTCFAGYKDFIIKAQGQVSTCFGDVFPPPEHRADIRYMWTMAALAEERKKMQQCSQPCFLACWTND